MVWDASLKVVSEKGADCVAGPQLEVMDRLGLACPQGMLLLTVIELAASVIRSFSNELQLGTLCSAWCTSINCAA